ncbi:hypothetical protein M8C21_003808 [Ambrosia artemisiifolia]|uniref:Uncharacterized protein n=1 Tax=Ambrosia artemisiifolia TaxID=4212 RepID=A0AAD5BUD3_AMBAR|nr:hypothetical protein M8C21_003808 [Ambrosia artemisiifolia]
MDYHSLKRKELQALCKEHGIPANSANSVLADKLSALLNEKQKPKGRTCMKSSVEIRDEGQLAESKRQSKKVRFSPNNDLLEYELRSGEKQKDMVTQVKTRRKSVAKKVDEPVVDNNITVELVEDTAQIPVRVTRSRVQSSVKDVPNNEKKKGRREAKDVMKVTEDNIGKVTRSKAHTVQKGGGVQREDTKESKKLIKEVEEATDTVEETVVGRVRVARSKAQTSMEGGRGCGANAHVKKKTGKQVKTDGHNVEPPKEEIIDVPVRATRSTRQTLKEDIGNTVTNPQANKKRTRREMKSTDLNSNSSHVAAVDKQEPPKRKSLRTRGVDKDEGDKMEVVNASRATRNSKNKATKVEVQELEEPLKHPSKKNVNRRKSVLQPDKTEDDPHLEEAVNQPTRRNTRRNSVVQKATMKVESSTRTPKSGKDKENVTRSGKDASVNDFKEVTTGTPKSRKRRGTSIIEDQVMETEYGSVDKSPKGSTRGAIKSERKSVAKKEVESSLKKSKSRMNVQPSKEKTSPEGKSSAIRSGAIIKGSSSKKRAKLSRTKQSDSEDHAVNSSKEWTPVAKLRNLELDEEVIDPEVSPAIDKSDRQVTRSTIKSEIKEPGQSARFTRSTIKSERKEPSQSAIKEQPTEVQLFSPKVAKLRSDPAVNTAPGRITRRGIKHDGNAAGSFSENVGKKKQTRQSALKKPHDDAQMPSPEVAEAGPSLDVGTVVQAEVKQSLDEVRKSSPEDAEGRPHLGVDALGVQSENKQPYDINVQMCSPEAVEVQPNPDGDTVGIGSESSIEVTGQILGDVSASGSARLPTKTVEENRVSVSGTAIDMESTSLVSGESASVEVKEDAGACIEKSTHEANATECVTETVLSGEQQNPPELQNFDAGTPLMKNLSHIKMTSVATADDAETLPDAVSDVSRVVHVESGIFNGQENPSSGNDVYVERDDAISDRKFYLDMFGTPLMGKGGIQDDGSSLAEELEAGSELSNAKNTLDVPASGIDITIKRVIEDNSDVRNGESEHDQLTSIANHATDNEDVRGDDSELAKNENMPGAAEVLVRSDDEEPEQSLNVAVDDVPRDTVGQSDSVTSKDTPKTLSSGGIDDVTVRVDAPEVLVVDINKDVVSSILGDTYDMDAEGDSGNEQKLAEGDDSFQRNESGVVSYDTSNEQTKEEAGAHRVYGHTFDDPEQAAPTHDDPDNGKIMEGSSHIGVKEAEPELLGDINAPEDLTREEASPILNTDGEPTVDGIDSSQVMGDIGACESLITKESSPITYKNIESPVDDTDSDLPTIKEDDRNKQEETRNASTFVDWGDYDFGMDEFEKPVSANGSSDMEGEGKKDDQDSNLQTSARTSYTREESSGLAAGLANSARKFDKDSGNAADVKSNQEEDMLKGSANATDMSEEVFNWSDSSMRSVSATPATTRIGHVRESLEEEVKFANQDTYSSLKALFVTPATTQITNVKTGQEEAVDLPNQDHYSSLKPLFKTPTTQISHVQDGRDVKIGQEDAVNFSNQDLYSSLKPLFKTPATQISHVQDGRDVKAGQEDAVIFANQDHYSSLKPLFKTPTAQKSHVQDVRDVKTGQEDAVNFANQDHYSSLKPLFKTPSTQISHVQDGRDVKTAQEDAFEFANQDQYSSLKSLFKTPAVTQTSHGKGGHEDAVDFANQDHYSSLKPLFKTPAVTQTSHVKGGQEDAVRYANHDPYSSLKPLFTTPATTQIRHVKDAQGESTNFANTDHHSSLKSLFATPATSRISHVNDCKTDAVNFTHSDGRCNENTGSSRTASHEFSHQWGNDQSKDLNGEETQGNAVRGPQNDIHGVSSFEGYPQKLFENEVGGSIDNSGSNTQFEFKQFEFLNEPAGTSHHNPSGLKDNSTRSSEFEKKEDTLTKGSEVNDDLGFGTGK